MAQIVGGLLCGGLAIFTIIALVMACIRRDRKWVVTSIIVALVGFSLLTAGALVALRRSGSAMQERSDARKTVLSDDGKVSLKIPPSWERIPNLHARAQLQFGNPAAEEYLVVLSEPAVDFAGNLDDYAAATAGALSGRLHDSEGRAPEALTIHDFPARRTRLAGTLGKARISYLHIAVQTPDSFHQIIQWTLPSKEAKTFPLFEEVAASFELAGLETPAH